MYDYHVHSSFSSDCDADMKDMIKKAIDMKLKEICFTDHIDYDYCDPSISFDFDLNEYTEYLNEMRKMYGEKIKILKGVEMGIQPHIIERCKNFINNGDFDFVIASLHTCEKKDLYTGDFFVGKTPKEAYQKYLEELLYCVKHFDTFNVVGHLNILIRYNDEVAKEKIEAYFDILEEILKTLINKNKGFEINTSGFRYSLNDLMPTYSVLKFYKELGGQILTLGYDSHIPNTLCQRFDYVYDVLKDIGFKYITTFEKMEPKFIKI
jgi:histidinol-phosphatase (PHP family)